MAYQVDRYNGLTFSIVEDRVVDSTSCDLRFLGKDFSGYGEVLNENFLHLLENFRGTSSPIRPIIGQLWYDETTNKIRYRDTSNSWRALTTTEVSSIPPTSLISTDRGTFWYDETNKQLNVWDGTAFQVVGPESAGSFGRTKFLSDTIRDNGNTLRPIIKALVDDVVVAVVSQEEFNIGEIDQISNFTIIKRGITLANTNQNGISTDNIFWGTSSNSIRLNGLDINSFVLRTPSGSAFDDEGFAVGNSSDLRFFIEFGNNPIIKSQLGRPIKLRITDNTENDEFIFSDESFSSNSNTKIDIGSQNNRWRDIYAVNFRGNVVGSVSGSVIGNVTGTLTGNSIGSHRGDIRAFDTSIAYDSNLKEFTGLFRGNVIGNVTGDSEGDHYGDVFASDNTIAYNHNTKTFTGTLLGNASTSSKFVSSVLINGVPFDGSQNITVTDESRLPKTGGALTGNLTLSADPTNPLHAATKRYVDNTVRDFYTSKPLIFSLDTKGLDLVNNTSLSVINILNTLAPPSNYEPGQEARISSSIQNVTSTRTLSTTKIIGKTVVTNVTVTTTVNNPTRNNNLVYRVNESRTSWQYVSG